MSFKPRSVGYTPPDLPTIKREVNKLLTGGVKRVGAKRKKVFVSTTSGGYLIGNIIGGESVARLTPVEQCPTIDVIPPKWFARSVEKALRSGTPQQVAYGKTLLVLAEAAKRNGCITLSDSHPLTIGAVGQPAIAQFYLDYGTALPYDRYDNLVGREIVENRLAQILTANLGDIAFME